jgi:hypothetical protein
VKTLNEVGYIKRGDGGRGNEVFLLHAGIGAFKTKDRGKSENNQRWNLKKKKKRSLLTK